MLHKLVLLNLEEMLIPSSNEVHQVYVQRSREPPNELRSKQSEVGRNTFHQPPGQR